MADASPATPAQVLDFWFGAGPQKWFSKDDAFDAAIRQRFLRTYEAGDHIGELAVLRDRPRAATVIADVDVRGLCIGGEALRAILQERPEAAMAMLATLAERISYQ